MRSTGHDGTNDTHYLSIPSGSAPSWLWADSYTLLVWCWRHASASTVFRIAAMLQNVAQVRISDTAAGGRIMTDSAQVVMVNAASCINGNEKWALVGISWNRSTNAFVVCGVSDGETLVSATGTAAPGTHTPGALFLGKNKNGGSDGGGLGTVAAWYGDIGACAVHGGALSQAALEAAVQDIFDRRDATGPLTSVASGLLNPKWVAMNWGVPQTVTGGTSGTRLGAAITDTNYVWLGHDDASPTEAEVEALFDAHQTFDVVGTVNFADTDTSFFVDPQPGLVLDGDDDPILSNEVGSDALVRIRDGDYDGVERVLCWGGTVGSNDVGYAGGPANWGHWGASWASGLAAHRFSALAGMCNVPVTDEARVLPIFEIGLAPAQSGTFYPLTEAPFSDFSRAAFGSTVANSNGPGAGIRFGSNGATLSQRARMTAGTLLDGTTTVKHTAVFFRYPGHSGGFATWAIEDADDVDGAGDPVDSGVFGVDLDSEDRTHTYDTPADSYNAGTRTLSLVGFNATGIVPLEWFVHVKTGGSGTGAIAQIESVTPGATAVITLVHPLGNTPSDGVTLSFGPGSLEFLEVTAPIPTKEYQGFTVTGDTGLVWLAVGAEAVGVEGLVPGPCGALSKGYADQIDQAFTGFPAAIVAIWDPSAAVLFHAVDNSGPEDREAMAALIPVDDASIVLAADMVHHLTDTVAQTWAEDALGQSVFPAVCGMELCGTLLSQYGRGRRQTVVKPSIEGLEHAWDAFFTAAAGIPEEPIDPEPEPESDLMFAAGERFRSVDRFRHR